LRLLLLNTDLEIGGTPTVVRELAMRLGDPQTHVQAASLKSAGPVGKYLLAQGIRVHALGVRSPFDVRRASRQLRSIIETESIDTVLSFLVHANVLAAMVAPSMPRVRFVQSIQTTQPRPRWHWLAQRWASRHAQRVLVPSLSVAQVARDWCDVPDTVVDVIPNAIDLDRFAFAPRPLDPADIRIGFVGRLDPVKRVQDLVIALTYLPANVRLDLFGEGAERGRIADLISRHRLADRVTLHGRVDDPLRAYRSIDVLVLPSDAEGFGLVLIEAMACGVGVIGTDVPGIRDVLGKQTGLLVSPRSPGSLAEAIKRWVEDEPMRTRLTSNGIEHVRSTFTWSATLPLWRSALGR
jgi:glycosyltransferase involved in cell wall biosynthesis